MNPYTLEYKIEMLSGELLVSKTVATYNRTNASLIALLFLIWSSIFVQIKSIILINSIFVSDFQLIKALAEIKQIVYYKNAVSLSDKAHISHKTSHNFFCINQEHIV